MKRFFLTLLILLLVLLIAVFIFNSTDKKVQDIKPTVVVSILPQKQFVEKIAQEKLNVVVMVPEGFSPATYEPTPNQLLQVSHADLYFRIGFIEFEKEYLDQIKNANPHISFVETYKNNYLLKLEEHSHEKQSEETNTTETIDPHLWLDPKQVIQQVEIITDALSKQYPHESQYFFDNKERYIQELIALDQELKNDLENLNQKTILVYHPAFGYLAHAYGFIQKHIEVEGKEPTIQDLRTIINQAKQEKITTVFVQKQFSTKGAETISSEINGQVIQLDPLAEDYLSNMRTIGQTIKNQ